MNLNNEKYGIMEVSEVEERLIKLLRSIAYGKVTIALQDNKVVRVEKITESYVL